MPIYDFKTLSPIDFELLSRDLSQEELGIRFESFKAGRDEGIDFRYCPSKDNLTIIQCKHYAGSTFSSLFSKFKSSELKKVKTLKPQRYILFISMGLTPKQKDKIYNLFKPFVNSPSDIFGKDEINGLLNKHIEIEKKHFKLWLSSVGILEEVLLSKIKNISREALFNINEDSRGDVIENLNNLIYRLSRYPA